MTSWLMTWSLLGNSRCVDAFRLFDRTYGADPLAYDFVFVSPGLAPHVRKVQVDLQTRASDHQLVLVEFDNAVAG